MPRLSYLVVTKLVPTKWSGGLERLLLRKHEFEDDPNNVSTSEQQENGRVDNSNSQDELFVSHIVRSTLRNNDANNDLIISDKKSAKNIQNYLVGI